MKKMMRYARLSVLLAMLCLCLSGCENEEESVRQALIDMGYMDPVAEASAAPEPAEASEPDAAPAPEEANDPDETPEVSAAPDSEMAPAPVGTSEPAPTPESATPQVKFPDLLKRLPRLRIPTVDSALSRETEGLSLQDKGASPSSESENSNGTSCVPE